MLSISLLDKLLFFFGSFDFFISILIIFFAICFAKISILYFCSLFSSFIFFFIFDFCSFIDFSFFPLFLLFINFLLVSNSYSFIKLLNNSSLENNISISLFSSSFSKFFLFLSCILISFSLSLYFLTLLLFNIFIIYSSISFSFCSINLLIKFIKNILELLILLLSLILKISNVNFRSLLFIFILIFLIKLFKIMSTLSLLLFVVINFAIISFCSLYKLNKIIIPHFLFDSSKYGIKIIFLEIDLFSSIFKFFSLLLKYSSDIIITFEFIDKLLFNLYKINL